MNRRVQYKSSSAAVLSDAISAASIEVRRTANNALATLYAEPTGTTTLENPFKAGNGKPEKLNEFEFWVDPDEYKISVRTALKNDTRIVSLLWSSKVSYDTRAELVNDVADGVTWTNGTIVTAGGRSYEYNLKYTRLTRYGLKGFDVYGTHVTLEHYGATGDGAADDQISYEGARGDGREVYLPKQKTYLIADNANPLGTHFSGPGKIISKVSGGHLQTNIPWEMSPVQFRHFAYSVKDRIIADAAGLKVVIAGDSTATNGWGANKKNLVLDTLEGLGIGCEEVLMAAAGGDGWGKRNIAAILDEYGEQKHLLLIKLGTNDAGGSLGQPIPDMLHRMARAMRTRLAQIRASKFGASDDLSIILIMPAAMGNNPKNENNRNNLWLEEIRGTYLRAARDYKCVLYDPYAESRWGQDQEGKSLCSFAVHPKTNYDLDIWGRALESVIKPYGSAQRNRIIMRRRSEGTAPRSDSGIISYPPGITYLCASNTDEWPFSGLLETIRHPDDIGQQTLTGLTKGFSQSTTRHWHSSVSAWSDWSGSTGKITLSLQNGWVAYGGTMGPPTASRSADGLVTLGGVCKNGTTVSGTVIATLPAEFSPGTDKIFAAVKLIDAMPVLCHIKITTSGDIETMPNVEQTFLGLDGITFDLHQI